MSIIKVPVLIGYQLSLSKKFKLSPSLGFNLEFISNYSENTTFRDGSEKETNQLAKDPASFLLISHLRLPLEYHFGKSVKAGVVPFIGYGLNKFTPESNSLPVTAGIGARIHYKI